MQGSITWSLNLILKRKIVWFSQLTDGCVTFLFLGAEREAFLEWQERAYQRVMSNIVFLFIFIYFSVLYLLRSSLVLLVYLICTPYIPCIHTLVKIFPPTTKPKLHHTILSKNLHHTKLFCKEVVALQT